MNHYFPDIRQYAEIAKKQDDDLDIGINVAVRKKKQLTGELGNISIKSTEDVSHIELHEMVNTFSVSVLITPDGKLSGIGFSTGVDADIENISDESISHIVSSVAFIANDQAYSYKAFTVIDVPGFSLSYDLNATDNNQPNSPIYLRAVDLQTQLKQVKNYDDGLYTYLMYELVNRDGKWERVVTVDQR